MRKIIGYLGAMGASSLATALVFWSFSSGFNPTKYSLSKEICRNCETGALIRTEFIGLDSGEFDEETLTKLLLTMADARSRDEIYAVVSDDIDFLREAAEFHQRPSFENRGKKIPLKAPTYLAYLYEIDGHTYFQYQTATTPPRWVRLRGINLAVKEQAGTKITLLSQQVSGDRIGNCGKGLRSVYLLVETLAELSRDKIVEIVRFYDRAFKGAPERLTLGLYPTAQDAYAVGNVLLPDMVHTVEQGRFRSLDLRPSYETLSSPSNGLFCSYYRFSYESARLRCFDGGELVFSEEF